MKYSKEEIEAAKKNLVFLMDGNYNMLVVHRGPPRSGSTRRTFDFFYLHTSKHGVTAYWLSPHIAKICGYKYNDNGICISGVGTDLVRHILDVLNVRMDSRPDKKYFANAVL